ncbi:DUF6449 domain-containing protein [Desulfallas thermosapovorans]|uniref:ABC-2 type transport system permease protein n=1 Tax=Desulfallas thermosapovorans DSM 6562 TaxID=1121431 RepID=A0A5S4ZTC1_9FIRM|nr:DUF6449 domain-containing protein [Desulfallas thermosapovorans]TYO95328.1 ABC-2 type transport system permease protein [Desulfallas thermosapovorans DSM 6562]
MKSKTSFLNKGFLVNDFRKYSWVAVAYTLALIFVIPLNILMMLGNEYITDKNLFKNLFLFINQEFQCILVLTVPVGLAILLFRYLHVRIPADALHSLPIKRSSIYRSHILAGIVLLISPVLITGIISIMLQLFLDLGTYYSINDVFRWMGITTLMNLTIFLTCVFVGMLVGMSTVQGVLTYILLLFPVGIIVLVTQNLEFFVYGFMPNTDYQSVRLSPITRIMEGFNPLSERAMSSTEVLAYVTICAVLFLLANYLYKIRDLETATQSIAFKKLRNIFKYGVTFCTMLLGGLYFQQTQQNLAWTVFGYLAGSLIGYVVAEILLQKSLGFFKEAKSFKGYAAFGAVVIILLLSVRFDLIGYEKRLPELGEVQQVYFSNSFYYHNIGEDNRKDIFSDQDNLQHIFQLHRSIIADKKDNYLTGNQNKKRQALFIYHLSDGSTMTRGYQIDYDKYTGFIKPIKESKEYKEMYYDILHVNPADVEKITLRPNMRTGGYKEAVILDPAEIKEAIDIMKQDVMRATYEQMTEEKEPWASISLLITENNVEKYLQLIENLPQTIERHEKDIQIHASWHKYDYLLESWLKEKGYYQKARVLPEEISYAVVERVENREQWEEKRRRGLAPTGQPGNESVKRLEIKDKKQIETCLREYLHQWVLDTAFTRNTASDDKYIISFYGKEQEHLEYGSFVGDNVPDFIRAYFAE